MGKGILLIVAAATIGGTAMIVNTKQLSRDMDASVSSVLEERVLAREIARSGMNMAIGLATRNWETIAEEVGESSAVGQEGGTYSTTASQLSPTELKLTVDGDFGGQTYEIQKTLVLAGPLDAAFVVDAVNAEPSFVDSDFFISGIDRSPPSSGTLTTALNKPGFKTNSTAVLNQFGYALGSRVANILGVNESGSVGSSSLKAESDWEVDLQALYDEAVNYTNKTVLPLVIEGGNYGTASSPVIAYIPGNATITGEVNGYGMLVIDGSLTVMDEFTWEGIVMLRDESDLNITYSGGATIYGSLIALQVEDDDWAFTMPTEGRLQVTYKYSSAGFESEVWIDPWGLEAEKVFNRGSNRTGDQMDVYDVVFPAGQRVNFFINVRGDEDCAPHSWTYGPWDYWDHYAAGDNSPSGKPYAEVEQLDEYKWEIRFEDLPEGHCWTDWDYNDQVIEVEIIPEDGGEGSSGSWWTWEEGQEAPPTVGSERTLYFTMAQDSRILYSAQAIASLSPLLNTIREATKVVEVDGWEGDQTAEVETE